MAVTASRFASLSVCRHFGQPIGHALGCWKHRSDDSGTIFAPRTAPAGLRDVTSEGRRPALTWVGLRGLEPRTSSLSGKRSNRLSYRPQSYAQPEMGSGT